MDRVTFVISATLVFLSTVQISLSRDRFELDVYTEIVRAKNLFSDAVSGSCTSFISLGRILHYVFLRTGRHFGNRHYVLPQKDAEYFFYQEQSERDALIQSMRDLKRTSIEYYGNTFRSGETPTHVNSVHQVDTTSGPAIVTNRAIQKPFFNDVFARNVTAVVGQQALLNCSVKYVGDRTVSWMRKKDLHILTSNIHTYTGDGRFSVIHPDNSDEWNLRIEFVQRRDAGIYECQVNTEPKINMAILLNVEAAQAIILGAEDVYVKKGSTISLTCTVNVHSSPPGTVVWYQGNTIVDFESSRGGISLETERTESGTTSKLLVTKASLADSGNYTCSPTNANAASVFVHVLNGEHPAAMQHGDHGTSSSKLVTRSWITMFALLAIFSR